jgi:hypothetical protein
VNYKYGQFPGDSEDKKTARMVLYRHAKLAPVQGNAVTLAGTEPEAEVSLMRDYLRWPTNRAWFIDKSKTPEISTALREIEVMWRGVNTRQSDLKDLAPQLDAIGFANLDLMGAPLGDNSMNCLKQVIPRLLPKSILGFTWIRGREDMSQHLSARRLWRLGKGAKGNDRRWVGVERAIENLSNGELVMIDKWEYFSNHSPMAVSIFRKE